MTNSSSRAGFLEAPRTFWAVALLIALLFSLTNLPWQLDDYDQAKQAFTSFEMVQSGHWLYQHTPNEKIATKPPLVGWISAALYGVTRSWEVAWRLPSIVAALLLAVALSRAAGAAYGRAAALLALAAFGLNLLAPRLATLVRTDMPLALIVFLLGLQIWQKVRSAESWTPRDRAVAFALLTCAMLVKGPIVYAFLLPGIVLYQLHRRQHRAGGNAWCGWWPWIFSLAIFLAWTAAGIAWVPGFYDQVVVREFAGRFGETVHRPQPIYFYLPHLLHKFAPWSVLVIALAIAAWRAERGTFAHRMQRLSPEIVWLLSWSLGGLLAMSLIPSKRVDRIFPLVPPLCLLLAAQVARSPVREKARRWSVIALGVAAVGSSIYTAQRVLPGYRSQEGALVQFGKEVRQEAAAHAWRYEVIGGKEEGLLLYLRRTRFISPVEAAARWSAGTLDALVVPAGELPALALMLPGAKRGGIEGAVTIHGSERRYVLLTRS
ncbi:MAG: ArnT family glycosyltransferase [Chthoniobacterales bacterium]